MSEDSIQATSDPVSTTSRSPFVLEVTDAWHSFDAAIDAVDEDDAIRTYHRDHPDHRVLRVLSSR